MSPPASTSAALGASDPDGATRILVVRHGQSVWNAVGRWQGQADPPLSEHGERQAAAAADVLAQLDVFVDVCASDLARAARTARIIADVIGIEQVELDQRLRENHVGPWEGLTGAEVEAGWPGFLDDHRRPPGFEAYDDAAARMIEALVDIAARAVAGAVLVVSHGGVLRAARRALGAPDARIGNLAGSWFTVIEGGVSAGGLVDLAGARPASGARLAL